MIYMVTHSQGFFLMRARLAEASAPIEQNLDPDCDDDSWSPTQWQTADARHDADTAARLLMLGFGSDFWAAPGDDRDHETLVAEAFQSCEPWEPKPTYDPTGTD